MSQVLLRAAALSFIIILGFFIQKIGLVPKEAGIIVRQLMFFLTIPATLIINFSKIPQLDSTMLWVATIGFFSNVIMLFLGSAIARGQSKDRQALYMLSLPGYGIGALTLPFVQNLLSPLGTVTTCFFDIGNCIMCSGASYAITAERLSAKKSGINFKSLGKRLLTSPPLLVSLFMTLLLFLRLQLPSWVLTMVEPIASANPFVSMIMLGLFLHSDFPQGCLGQITKIILFRTLFAVPVALMAYFFLPFDLIVRQALVLCCFAPISVNAPAFVEMCCGDASLSSLTNSVSIFYSLIITTASLRLMGLT